MRSAYQNNDIRQFEKILKNNRRTIMDDRFVSEYIQGEPLVLCAGYRLGATPGPISYSTDRATLPCSPPHPTADLLKNIRTEVLVKLIQPYTRVRIPFISKALNIPEEDVEALLVSCILDK